MRVIARAPTRLDLGGGWTDVPPVCADETGAVTAIAIARHATVTLEAAEGLSDDLTMEPLARFALRRAGLHGVQATVNSNFPVGAGLGGSGAAGVALQGAIAAWRGEFVEPMELVRRARIVETEDLKVAGGWQDYCAAAFGGVLGMRFGADLPTVRPLAVSDAGLAGESQVVGKPFGVDRVHAQPDRPCCIQPACHRVAGTRLVRRCHRILQVEDAPVSGTGPCLVKTLGAVARHK